MHDKKKQDIIDEKTIRVVALLIDRERNRGIF